LFIECDPEGTLSGCTNLVQVENAQKKRELDNSNIITVFISDSNIITVFIRDSNIVIVFIRTEVIFSESLFISLI
jgi:hypothetical protein